jgi:dienelactone hydrolase
MAVAVTACATSTNPQQEISIVSLSELSIETLRQRTYSSELELVAQLGNTRGGTEYSQAYGTTGSGPYETYLASYQSDDLRLYTRIDIPNSPPPVGGYPIIIFCHGWMGIDAAPTFHFSYTPKSMYAEMIDGYVDAGFIVLTPGYRGHGTANGVAADGIEFMSAWDNASYLSPSFYAIDVLNLIEGLDSIAGLRLNEFDSIHSGSLATNLDEVFLTGHSQGGDVVLTTLAVVGEGSQVAQNVKAASISDGTFADRATQLELYTAMQGSRRAFLSGDGSWTGTSKGADGSINPEFVFGYPPGWLETPQPSEWTNQAENWPDVPVSDVVSERYLEMSDILSRHVRDLAEEDSSQMLVKSEGRYPVQMAPDLSQLMLAIGGYDQPAYLTEPLMLHYSDQDFYSPPAWNEELCRRISEAGGVCTRFLYPANSHLMRASEYSWFSPAGTTDSYRTILARDVSFFEGMDPSAISYP